MLEAGKELIGFLQAHADTRRPLETDRRNGDLVAFTNEDAPDGFRDFIYLEGTKAGEHGVMMLPEVLQAEQDRKKKASLDFQAGIRRVRDSGKSDQLPQSKATPAPEQPTAPELSAEEKSERAQMIRDMMATNKSNGKPIPQGWVNKLAELEGQPKAEEDEIYSRIVPGHPQHEVTHGDLRYLVPIKVRKSSDLASKFEQTQKLRDKWNKEIGTAEYALKQAKTPAQKKKAQDALNKLSADRDAREALINETIPELERLHRELSNREKAAQLENAAAQTTNPKTAETLGKGTGGVRGDESRPKADEPAYISPQEISERFQEASERNAQAVAEAPVFTRDEIVISTPSVSRRKRPTGTDGESVTTIDAPGKVTSTENWYRLSDTDRLAATVEAKLDFATGKAPKKTDAAWTAYSGRRTQRSRHPIARGVTYEQAIEAAKDYVLLANPVASPPSSVDTSGEFGASSPDEGLLRQPVVGRADPITSADRANANAVSRQALSKVERKEASSASVAASHPEAPRRSADSASPAAELDLAGGRPSEVLDFEQQPLSDLSRDDRLRLTAVQGYLGSAPRTRGLGFLVAGFTPRPKAETAEDAGRGGPVRRPVGSPAGSAHGSGSAVLDTIRAFEQATGRKVFFIGASDGRKLVGSKGRPLFSALTPVGFPDAIYINKDAPRHVLALIGHEWGHTVDATNPVLYHAFKKEALRQLGPEAVAAMREDRRKAGYTEAQLDEEVVNNVIGDAFLDPDFWRKLQEHDRPLWQKMVEAVTRWINNLIDKVRKSEFGTTEVLRNLDETYQALIELMNGSHKDPGSLPRYKIAGIDYSSDALPVTPQQDAAYLSAVESGDMEAVQRMVDEAAKNAGYAGPFWRGETAAPQKTPPHVHYLSSNKWLAGTFSESGVAKAYYIKAENILDADAEVRGPVARSSSLTKEEVQRIKKAGYDAVQGEMSGPGGHEIAVLSSSQIKSADPVTRDAQGKVIPLSERFNPESSDIRFSAENGPEEGGDLDARAKSEAVATDSGAAQPTEPSPGGLTEADRHWARYSEITDSDGEPLIVYHGTRAAFDQFARQKGGDNGFHFGTKAQASMRVGKQGSLKPFILKARKLKRLRDRGSWTKDQIARTKRDGYDGIVYLNRYEGTVAARNEAALKRYTGEQLDRLSDSEFSKLFPENEDSYVVFDNSQIRPVNPESRASTTDAPGLKFSADYPADDVPAPDLERARAAAAMPNAPDSESQARPLKDELGGGAQDYTAFTHEDMQRRAVEVVDAVDSLDEMARKLSSEDGVRSLGLAPDLMTYVQAETLKRAHAAVTGAANDVDRIRATQTLRKVRALVDVTGTEAGQHMAARKLALQGLRDGLPEAMSVDTAIEKQQKVTIDKAIPVEPVKQTVEKVATEAGPVATEKLSEALTPKADKALETARQKLLAQDSPALAKLLNELRKKIAPGLKWRDIFTSQKQTQREWELEIYDRIRRHEALQDLSPEQQVLLTRELSKAWQRERRAVFNHELEKQLPKVPGVKPAAVEKVKASAPRLLQLINLGALDSAAFRDALAQEWGIANLNSPEAKHLKDLATRAQQEPEGLPRRKLEQQFIEGLQDLTKLSRLEILENWWTASVLSGWRTHADILLSVGNGIEDVGLGAIVTAIRTGNADVAYRAIGRVLANLPTAIQEALHHIVTGDRSMMRNYDAEVKAAEQDGHKLMSNAGRQLLKQGGMYKAPGAFMELIARMLTAWDHLNSSSTFEGAKLMALARHPELYQQALRIGPRERDNARAQARSELTAGVAPTTKTERMQENARAKEILDAELPTEIIAQATELGRDAALQGDPTGLGHAVWWLARQIGRVPDMGVAAIEQSGVDNAAARLVLAALRRASTISRVLTGSKFVRTAAHALNRQISYVPGVGLLRFAEGNMQGAKADILIAKQLLGTAVGLTLLAAFRARDDDEEGIEGSWKGLTSQQRSQLYAQGKQPNTVWYRDGKNRIVSFNFNQWGIAGIMGTIGAMEDQRRYQGNDSELSILVNGIVQGSMQFLEKAQLQGLQQIFGDSAYSTSGNVTDGLAKRLNRYAATTVGGMVPRIAKDVDAVIAPELHDASAWWAQWAAQVPMLRELSSGKRVDILGKDVTIDRGPLSRVTQSGTADGAYRIVGQLNERDLWLPDPSTGVRMVKEPNGERREMSLEEKDRYQRFAGAGYKAFVIEHGDEILAMEHAAAEKFISRQTKVIRDQAAEKVAR